jgi:hypothetical protein
MSTRSTLQSRYVEKSGIFRHASFAAQTATAAPAASSISDAKIEAVKRLSVNLSA